MALLVVFFVLGAIFFWCALPGDRASQRALRRAPLAFRILYLLLCLGPLLLVFTQPTWLRQGFLAFLVAHRPLEWWMPKWVPLAACAYVAVLLALRTWVLPSWVPPRAGARR